MKKEKILYLTHYSALYGANRSLINMINTLKDDFEPIVIIPTKGAICSELDKLQIKYFVVFFMVPFVIYQKNSFSFFYKTTIKIILYPIIMLIALCRLIYIALIYKVKIIHSNTSLVTLGYRLSRILHIKHIWHLREFQDIDFNFISLGNRQQYIKKMKKSDEVIAVSHAVSEHFHLEGKSIVLYNAVMKKNSSPLNIQKEKYFLFCGVVTENKGVEDAINSLASVLSIDKEVNLLVAGEIKTNDYNKYLLSLVDELGIKEHVHFLGFRTDISILMQKAQALLMCSKNEAMGRVTAEAMLNKCLVIGYNNAGTAELITHNKTGFLYNNNNELVEYMNFVLKRNLIVTEIERQAYDYSVQNFTEEIYGKKIKYIYKKHLDELK